MIDHNGWLLIQSGCGALSPKIHFSTPLKSPYDGLYSACFHSRAAATGTTRNGVIIIVRTTPRPRNFRSSSSAISNPRTRLIKTTPTVSRIVTQIAFRVFASVSTRRKLSTPANPRSSG
jgi:hypothetical protein